MSVKLWEANTANAFSTSLNGSIGDSDDTIALTSVTGLVAPGILVIDRQDGNENNTPTIREYVSYTGISGNDLTGVTRGVAGSSAQNHSSGALVEEVFSITHWNDMIDFLQVSHDSNGHIAASLASLDTARIYGHLNAANASITGKFPLNPVWVVGGYVSLPTSGVGKPLPIGQTGQLSYLSAVLAQPVSGSSLVLDINLNGVSVFTDQNTRLSILGGGTFVSTASIGTIDIPDGSFLTADIDNGGGLAQELVIRGRII